MENWDWCPTILVRSQNLKCKTTYCSNAICPPNLFCDHASNQPGLLDCHVGESRWWPELWPTFCFLCWPSFCRWKRAVQKQSITVISDARVSASVIHLMMPRMRALLTSGAPTRKCALAMRWSIFSFVMTHSRDKNGFSDLIVAQSKQLRWFHQIIWPFFLPTL